MNLRFSLILLSFIAFTVAAQEIHVDRKYRLENLGEGVNSRLEEGSPVISPDGKTLYFFVQSHPDNTYGADEMNQDIWVSRLQDDGTWSKAEHLGSPLNENHFNQVFTVLNEGNTLFIRGGKKKEEVGFSLVNRSGNGWGRPQEIEVEGFEEMNKNQFYGASLSSDGEHMILYFSTNPTRVYSDLFYSKKISDTKYSKPIKLKGNINTLFDEFGPFISPDNEYMYFASSKPGGEGGPDLYVTKRLDNSWLKWSEPENLGPPINTGLFDGYISVDNAGDIYVSVAGKKIDGGNLDIFRVIPRDISVNLEVKVLNQQTLEPVSTPLMVKGNSMDSTFTTNAGGNVSTTLPGKGDYTLKASPEGFEPGSVNIRVPEYYSDTVVQARIELVPLKEDIVLAIKVLDSKTNELIPESKLKIRTQSSGFDSEEIVDEQIASTGEYRKVLDQGNTFLIEAKHSGYLEGSTEIAVGDQGGITTAIVYLDPIEVGTTVVLKNIYFDFDKTTLKSESFVELDKVVQFLNDNPTLEIEISGHTDSKGSDDYNKNLSQGRAETVVQYLIDHGIDAFRLQAMGYGEEKPVATNDTDEGRAENRRVEFTVLSK